MPSELEQLLGSIIGHNQPTAEETSAQIKCDLDILERMWEGDDKDSGAARGYITAARVWYAYLDAAKENSKVNMKVADALQHFIQGIHQTLDELHTLGRLRCDAIEAATGTNPLPDAEEKQIREDLMAELRRKRSEGGDNPHPADAAWANAAEPTG